MKFQILFRHIGGLLLASVSFLASAQTQSGMQRAAEPYVAKPEIRFLIDRTSIKAEPVITELSHLVEYGVNPSRNHAYQGARDVSLRDALRAITPPIYNIRSSACVPMHAPAGFSSGANWPVTLNAVAADNGLNISIDHAAREVVVVKTAAINPNEKRTWVIFRSDTTIKRALERWAEPSCVTLQWDVPYPMSADADVAYPDMTLWEAFKAFAADMEASNSPVRVTQSRNNSIRVYLDSSR